MRGERGDPRQWMAKKTTRKKSARKTSKKVAAKGARSGGRASRGIGFKKGMAEGKHLVIVESPSKAKTINRYLGSEYLVLASVGHVRDLPTKGAKNDPVPGVDIEHKFKPTYEVLSGKDKVVNELKRAAGESIRTGKDVWFATDLDREGEAIAWHLAEELGISPEHAKRVIFSAITKTEIDRAFHNPHTLDLDKVNAQQARRILDRIVGYQVSPLLWKKVARGLSAGRVQSVAVRLVVEREREIRGFVPDEYWQINANFALSEKDASRLAPQWSAFVSTTDEKGNSPTQKAQNAWLADQTAIRAELMEVGGEKFDVGAAGIDEHHPDLTGRIQSVAELAGLTNIKVRATERADGRGPARWARSVTGDIDTTVPYAIKSIETKRTSSRPPAPFITSTLQQAASTRLGFGAQRTMRAAQQLYEGVEIPGEGPVGLITYMRTDSTHLANEAIDAARSYIGSSFGDAYLPDAPRRYTSSNKAAQEAHEAIRPTMVSLSPKKVKSSLTSDQFRLYQIIWERFVACQMADAQWDATTVLIEGGTALRAVSGGARRDAMADDGSESRPTESRPTLTFKATGRVIVFDGFYKASGVPTGGDQQTLPALEERQDVRAFAIEPRQRFTQAPARYTEASLIKMLESEGIGRPSTYASIIQVIQDRNYVEQLDKRFHSTDLGEVVTDKLIEAFPRIMDIGYTRTMEAELDAVEEDHLDWIEMLERFYGAFKENLARAHEELKHAKAEVIPAPKEYRCQQCGAGLVYRFGKNGRFLSCSRYPDCDYACPVDRQGRPQQPEIVNIACPKTGRPMVRRTGRFGPFLATKLNEGEPQEMGMILNIDKKGFVVAPSRPPLETELPCPTCEAPLNLRAGARGPWLGCSRFPKCRGRGKWSEIEEKTREGLEKALAAHEKAHPIPIIRTLDGRPLTDANGKPLADAPSVADLTIPEDRRQEVIEERLGSVA
jgi:DNA topoisomerase-1